MVSWNNLDTLSSYKELADVKPACLTEVMSGDNGAERVKNYSIPMAAGLSYNYASTRLSRKELQNLLTRYITVRLLMQPARSSQLLSRSVSAEATSVPVQCT